MSIAEGIHHYYGPTSKLISSNRKVLQLLSFPYDQFSAQPMIRCMDHNGCSAKILLATSILPLYSSNDFSVVTDHFDSINALVAVHATKSFDMLVQSYLGFGPLAASLALRSHAH